MFMLGIEVFVVNVFFLVEVIVWVMVCVLVRELIEIDVWFRLLLLIGLMLGKFDRFFLFRNVV